jgi:hypothetical protein
MDLSEKRPGVNFGAQVNKEIIDSIGAWLMHKTSFEIIHS